MTITGNISDTGGGVVGGVEVSVDGGATWHPASGRASWTYAWTVPGAPGSVTIRSRAADDSGNLETPSAGITVTVGTVPIAVNDTFLYRANVLRKVNTPGVLANDTGNPPLTAQLVTGSLSGGGTLNFAANGPFTYLRTSNSNTVSFRYRANDGSGALSEPEPARPSTCGSTPRRPPLQTTAATIAAPIP